MKKLFPYIAIAIFFCSCQGKNTGLLTDSTASNNNYTVPDGQAIKKAVDNAYAAISFKAGEEPRYDSIKNYFIPKAQLIAFVATVCR